MGKYCRVVYWVNAHQIETLAKICLENGNRLNMTVAAEKLGVKYHNLYKFFRSGRNEGLFTVSKVGGLSVISFVPTVRDLAPPLDTEQAKLKQNRQNANNGQDFKKISSELFNALKILNKFKGWGQTEIIDEKGTRRFKFFSPLHEAAFNRCVDLFRSWLLECAYKKLIFQAPGSPDIIEMEYKNRFTDNGRKMHMREVFDDVFNTGTRTYKSGSFITLTTNPDNFENMYDANKEMSKNWNRLITFLRRKTGRKLRYVNVREFQKNGRLHMHVIVFGLSLKQDVVDKRRNIFTNSMIQNAWIRYGQGSITNVIPLKYDNDRGLLTWVNDKPDDCAKNEDPIDYLKKYLSKVFKGNFEPEFDLSDNDYKPNEKDLFNLDELPLNVESAYFHAVSLFQYWANSCRFYTYSPDLLSGLLAFQRLIDKFLKRERRKQFPLKMIGVYDEYSGIFRIKKPS